MPHPGRKQKTVMIKRTERTSKMKRNSRTDNCIELVAPNNLNKNRISIDKGGYPITVKQVKDSFQELDGFTCQLHALHI